MKVVVGSGRGVLYIFLESVLGCGNICFSLSAEWTDILELRLGRNLELSTFAFVRPVK